MKTIVFDEKTNKRLRILALAVIVILISWPPLFMSMAKGHDMLFHLQRIEGIREDASWHSLPVRMQSGWMQGYGYPVSVLYGDMFLYIGAIFRKIGLPVMASFRLFLLCVNTATVVISYFSFKTFNKGWAPVIATFAYTASSYRLVDVYVRSAIGETLAITFFPAIVACMHMIYVEADRKCRRRYAVIMSFAFLAVILSHTLTTSMMLVVLALLCPVSLVIFGIKGERLRQFGDIVISGLLTIVLAAFFIVPFLDFYLTADIAFALDKVNHIQGEGVDLASLLEFVCNPFENAASEIQRTPGPVLMTALVAALIYIAYSFVRKVKFANRGRMIFEAGSSLLLLLMSSRVFPWDWIEENVPVVGGIVTAIEFPMRYLAFAIVFLAFLTCDLFGALFVASGDEGVGTKSVRNSAIKWISSVAVCLLCIFNIAQLCLHSRTYDKRADFATREDLGVWEYYSMDFQLANSTVENLPLGLVYEGLESMEVLSRNSNDFQIAVTSGPEYGWIQLPVFNYKYYHAEDLQDPSVKFEIHDGGNRTVGVLLPGNYSGIVHIYWQEPILWRITELISLLTFIACAVYLLRSARQK